MGSRVRIVRLGVRAGVRLGVTAGVTGGMTAGVTAGVRAGVRLGVTAGVSLGMSSAVVGCTTATMLTTPRALDAGGVQVVVAPHQSLTRGTHEASGVGPDVGPVVRRETEWALLPPSVAVRVGLGKGIDLGGRLGGLGRVGALDAKVNFLRGPIDAAVVPAVHLGEVTTLDLPLLVGVNSSGGFGAFASLGGGQTVTDDTPEGRLAPPTRLGTHGRVGVGARLPATTYLAFLPEVAALRTFNDANFTIYTATLGLVFGHQPAF